MNQGLGSKYGNVFGVVRTQKYIISKHWANCWFSDSDDTLHDINYMMPHINDSGCLKLYIWIGLMFLLKFKCETPLKTVTVLCPVRSRNRRHISKFVLYGCHIHPVTRIHDISSGLILLPWASYRIRQIAGAHAPGMPGIFSPPAGKRSRHASRHVRDARAVMHAGIAN